MLERGVARQQGVSKRRCLSAIRSARCLRLDWRVKVPAESPVPRNVTSRGIRTITFGFCEGKARCVSWCMSSAPCLPKWPPVTPRLPDIMLQLPSEVVPLAAVQRPSYTTASGLSPSQRLAFALHSVPLSVSSGHDSVPSRQAVKAHDSSSNRRARLLALTGDEAPKLPWCWIGNEEDGCAPSRRVPGGEIRWLSSAPARLELTLD